MKPLVLIISRNTADREAINQAAVSQGCRTITAGSIDEARASLKRATPHLLLFDAELANGGGTLRSVVSNSTGTPVPVTLIVSPGIKPGHLKALKPWARDYLTTPVLREAAAAHLRNVFRMRDLERSAEKATDNLDRWLTRFEAVVKHFEPLSFDRRKAQDDLAQRLLRGDKANETEKPAFLMFGVPDAGGGLQCEFYGSNGAGPEKLSCSFTIPEPMILLRIKSGNGMACFNYTDRGGRLADFQASFPPELLQVTGTLYNLAGIVYSGAYIVAFNYGRSVTAEDALFLKGLAVPGSFLSTVAGDMQHVSESFLVMAKALAIATDSQGDGGAHVIRMNEYAKTLAESMSLPERFVKTLAYSAQLHDVGKIYIHPDLLEKPFRLTSQEFDLVKKHPVLGAQILGDSPVLSVAKNIALTHHECWDGTGYPNGLCGESIPIEGAIVKLADVYDALRTMQTYKSSYSHDAACRIILDGGGDGVHSIHKKQFHPKVLTAFKSNAGRFDEIYQSISI